MTLSVRRGPRAAALGFLGGALFIGFFEAVPHMFQYGLEKFAAYRNDQKDLSTYPPDQTDQQFSQHETIPGYPPITIT